MQKPNATVSHRILITAVLALSLGGCVVSLNPLYLPEQLVVDARLVGRWVDDDGAEWHFAHREGLHYELTYWSEKAEPQTVARQPLPLEAHLVQLGEHRFLDLTVEPKSDENSLFDLHLLPVHSLWRVVLDDDTMTLESLDSRWLEAALADRDDEGRLVEVENWRVLTGSTEQLQALVQRMVNSGEGFSEPGLLRRVAEVTPAESVGASEPEGSATR